MALISVAKRPVKFVGKSRKLDRRCDQPRSKPAQVRERQPITALQTSSRNGGDVDGQSVSGA